MRIWGSGNDATMVWVKNSAIHKGAYDGFSAQAYQD